MAWPRVLLRPPGPGQVYVRGVLRVRVRQLSLTNPSDVGDTLRDDRPGRHTSRRSSHGPISASFFHGPHGEHGVPSVTSLSVAVGRVTRNPVSVGRPAWPGSDAGPREAAAACAGRVAVAPAPINAGWAVGHQTRGAVWCGVGWKWNGIALACARRATSAARAPDVSRREPHASPRERPGRATATREPAPPR